MTKNKLMSLACPAAFFAFGLWVRISALSMARRDTMFPIIVSYAIMIISVIDFISEMRKTEHKNRFAGVNFRKVGECLVAMCAYVLLIKKIGFFFDTLWLTAFTMWSLDYKNYKVLVLSALLITGAVFGAFRFLMKVPLPTVFL